MARQNASVYERLAERIELVQTSRGMMVRMRRKNENQFGGIKKRVVKAKEKSRGESPITLNHRKPTKKEAAMFRQLLVARRRELAGDVAELEAEAFSDEHQVVSTNHLAESAFAQYEQEFNLSLIESGSGVLKEIERAIDKIDEDAYGECEACGVDISIERLKALPFTRICIDCRTRFEEEGGGEEFGVLPDRRV